MAYLQSTLPKLRAALLWAQCSLLAHMSASYHFFMGCGATGLVKRVSSGGPYAFPRAPADKSNQGTKTPWQVNHLPNTTKTSEHSLMNTRWHIPEPRKRTQDYPPLCRTRRFTCVRACLIHRRCVTRTRLFSQSINHPLVINTLRQAPISEHQWKATNMCHGREKPLAPVAI